MKKYLLLFSMFLLLTPINIMAANVHQVAPNVPAKIRNDFVSCGGTLKIVNYIPGGKQGKTFTKYSFRRVKGKITDYRIIPKIHIYRKAKNFKKTVAHEFGHFFDKCLSHYHPQTGKMQIYSKTDKTWLNFYRRERNRYKKLFKSTSVSYVTGSPNEFFAQCCADYWLAPSRFKKANRKQYIFMKKLINRYLASSQNGKLSPGTATKTTTSTKKQNQGNNLDTTYVFHN